MQLQSERKKEREREREGEREREREGERKRKKEIGRRGCNGSRDCLCHY